MQRIRRDDSGGTETFVTEIVTDTLHRVIERRVVDRLNSANKHVFKTKYTSLGVAVEEEDALGNKTYAWHDGLGPGDPHPAGPREQRGHRHVLRFR